MKYPKFASFSWDNGQRTGYGLVTEQRVTNLQPHYGKRWPTLKEAIADNTLSQLAEEAMHLTSDLALSEIQFEVPLAHPGKIICVGVNYPNRDAEYQDQQPAFAYPSLFIRFPCSFTGHQQPLFIPNESEQFDYEGEVAIIIGQGGRRIAEDKALSHIAALTLCNEGSVRDWMRHAKFNVTQGKNFDKSGSMGPWIVPYLDPAQLADIRLTTRVNGELRQDDRTSRMTFSFAWLISYISTFTTLEAGDIIVTGTPTGSGARFTPPLWLKPGDVVEIEAEGLGILRNTVIHER